MRRTKAWWAALDECERVVLVSMERGNSGSGYGAGGYLPDDCSECKACGQPMLGCGWCQSCCNEHTRICEKADRCVREASK